MIRLVVGLAVVAFVIAIIIPMAFTNLFGTDTSSWDAQTVLMWAAIPAVVLLAIILVLLNRATDAAQSFALPLIAIAAFAMLWQASMSAQVTAWIAGAMLMALAAITLMLHKTVASRAVSR